LKNDLRLTAFSNILKCIKG